MSHSPPSAKSINTPSSKSINTFSALSHSASCLLPPPLSERRTNWRALPPDACPSPRSHIPSDEEIIDAIAFVWCIYWNSFSTMDPAGLRARILAKHTSWDLLERRVADVRYRALTDGRLRRPAFEVGLRMQPSLEEVLLREHAYDFDPRWRSARRAQVCKLQRSFEITSGTSSIYCVYVIRHRVTPAYPGYRIHLTFVRAQGRSSGASLLRLSQG